MERKNNEKTIRGRNRRNNINSVSRKPVASEADLARTNFDANGKPTDGETARGYSVSECSEPYASGYSDGNGTEEAEEYNTMKTQVLKYGGFYIGRYEAGINSTELRTGVTEAQEVVSKKGVAPYNYVLWGASMSDINSDVTITLTDEEGNETGTVETKGAVYLAKNMYSSSNSVTSTLVYGCQWDAMCRYIGDPQRTTPTKSALQLTGSVSTDVSKNIYDLAGNCRERTMEARGAYRVYRGGFFSGSNPYPVWMRSVYQGTKYASTEIAFRTTLYIK